MKTLLVLTSYPPRPCGIATYSHDLIAAMRSVSSDYNFVVCALENGKSDFEYSSDVRYILDTSRLDDYEGIAEKINSDESIDAVYVQHEFGLYGGTSGANLLLLLYLLNKPVFVTFHTAIPAPTPLLRTIVRSIAVVAEKVVVMTDNAKEILQSIYQVDHSKIEVIPHGTHGINHIDRDILKSKYQLDGRLVLSTFGLLNEGKSIETSIDAMREIVSQFPESIFLVLGRTHPEVVKRDGETYRASLIGKVRDLGLENHVRFVNKYLSLEELLEYLQLTDLYLFASKDPVQAVSGTFSYALSAGCPIVSTPIPHAREVLNDEVGALFDFRDSVDLSKKVMDLLGDPLGLERMRLNALQKMQPTLWENSALSHIKLFKKALDVTHEIGYSFPAPKMDHLEAMTTIRGIVQFAKLNVPDLESGYTLDDNARALIASCLMYDRNKDTRALDLIPHYLDFIASCQQADGGFINYIDQRGEPHIMNNYANLEDSNGRAIWAIGHFLRYLPEESHGYEQVATDCFEHALSGVGRLSSPRAIAFAIKGLRLYNELYHKSEISVLIRTLADKLMSNYRESSSEDWPWFETYLTYGNAVLPEGLLNAWLETGRNEYLETAKVTFDFLLSQTIHDRRIRVISNRGWRTKNATHEIFGEQPIDVSYTVQALAAFSDVFQDDSFYSDKIYTAMSWFYGNNHLNRYVYSPSTGGCYDGLEESNVNLNQGAESTACYLIARCIAGKYISELSIQTTVPEASNVLSVIK